MLRFRLTLLILLGGLILLTVVTVGVSSYWNSRSAAHELSEQVLEQTSLRIEQQVEKLLSHAASQCSLTVRLLKSGQLSSQELPKLVEYWQEVLAVQPEMTSYFIGLEETGEAVGVSQLQKDRLSIWQTKRNPQTAKLELCEYWLADYPHTPFKSGAEGPDVRTRPWFASARQKGQPVWTETYVFLGVEGVQNILGVTYAVPAYKADGAFQAVVSADFDLETLSRFLASLSVGRRGSAFLVEQGADGDLRIIAHPRSEILVRPGRKGSSAGRELVQINEFDDVYVRAFLKQLPANAGSEAYLGTKSIRFRADGVSCLGSFHRISGESKPRWMICTFVPEDEILAYANQSNRQTLLITVGVLGLAIMLGFYLARQVAQPLEQLAADALAAGNMRLESRPRIRSIVREVDQLAKAGEEMKAGLRSFEKYISVDLVRSLLDSGQEARLGGEKRIVTVAFTDIAGFTSIAESMPSEVLVAYLGEYLGALSQELLQSGGTVDKFIGDAIMAFWGAPVLNPDNATAACVAACRCQQRLRELRPEWLSRGGPAFHTRFGLHTGEVIVGNIGSPLRMNYTVMGDAANLASRLEGLNKYYGTEILLSEQTYQQAKEVIVARRIDVVAVAGRAEAVAIYELMGLASDASPSLTELANQYERALYAFQKQCWSEALALLDQLLQLWPGDNPSRALMARCQEYLIAPPADGWDGVHRMTSK